MRSYGFIRPGIEVDPQRVLDYLRPILDPLAVEEFTFTREWMRAQAARMGDPRSEEARVGRMFNLPPSYLLIHRVTLGSLAVLCQLGATAPFRALAEQWQPGFAEPVGRPPARSGVAASPPVGADSVDLDLSRSDARSIRGAVERRPCGAAAVLPPFGVELGLDGPDIPAGAHITDPLRVLAVRAVDDIGTPAERWITVHLPVGDAPAHGANRSHAPCVARPPDEVQRRARSGAGRNETSGAGPVDQCAISLVTDAGRLDGALRSERAPCGPSSPGGASGEPRKPGGRCASVRRSVAPPAFARERMLRSC